jgi:hypothetical protein
MTCKNCKNSTATYCNECVPNHPNKMSEELKKEWEIEFVKTFYVYNLIKGTPAGAEKEALQFINSLLQRTYEVAEKAGYERAKKIVN